MTVEHNECCSSKTSIKCPSCQHETIPRGVIVNALRNNLSLPFVIYECTHCGTKTEKSILPTTELIC